MHRKLRPTLSRFAVALPMIALCVGASPSSAQITDEHSVEAITVALHSPIPQEVLEGARALDDQLLTTGRDQQGTNIYLVTDARLDRARRIMTQLLRANARNPNDWVVRVLDTNPPTINAFVFGGRYVYVFAGLMDFVSSDDELAFILAHELGHSLLQHQYRKSQDISTAIANIAVIIGELWKRNRQAFYAGAAGITSSYSRLDEEEADALGALIAYRAGFDPLQGAGLFSRMRQQEDGTLIRQKQALDHLLVQTQQIGAACAADQQLYRYPQYRTPANYQLVMNACQQYQTVAAQYNETVQSFNAQLQQRSAATIFSDHPAYNERVSAIAAVTDYLAGRRALETLADHQQSYRVLRALVALQDR